MILLGVMVGFTLVCLPAAYWLGGSSIRALLAAVAVCVAPGLAAVTVSHYFAAADRHLSGMLLAMGCRILPPLVVCMWLALNPGAPEGRTFAAFLIAAYLTSLAAETFLTVRSIDLHRHHPPLD